MTTPAERFPENAPGPLYVTRDCIDCDVCRSTAPLLFQRHQEVGFSVVVRQPATKEERELAMEALAGCPVDAIVCDPTQENPAANPEVS